MPHDEEDQGPSRFVPEPPPSLIPPPERSREVASDIPPPPITVSRFPSAPPSRSLPPMPAVEPILELAEELRKKEDWDGALEAYKKALFVVDEGDTNAQASIYASVAEVKLAQGKSREAETNFEKALVKNQRHLRSIDG